MRTREAYPTEWADTIYDLMKAQYNRRNASVALVYAVQLEAAPTAIQHFSSDKRDLVYLVKESGGPRSETDMSCSEANMSSAEAALRTLCGFRYYSG